MGTGGLEPEVELFRRHGGGLRMSEALRMWREQRRGQLDALLEYAHVRLVDRAMRPCLESMP